jgi:hypothetical protein
MNQREAWPACKVHGRNGVFNLDLKGQVVFAGQLPRQEDEGVALFLIASREATADSDLYGLSRPIDDAQTAGSQQVLPGV